MVSTAEQTEAFHSLLNTETTFNGNVSDMSKFSAATAGSQQWLFSPMYTTTTAMSALYPANVALTNFDDLQPNAFTVPVTVVPVLSTFKDVIKFRCCTLYPPKANTAKVATRERPPGCRTVFIGGIPDNATEDILKEVFSIFGTITAIRISKKNFCHIRYENEESVDKALIFSGHRMKINEQDDAANTGRLHVDFAQARDDQHEFECKQRAFRREMRHRGTGEKVTYSLCDLRYSEHETVSIIEKLKNEESFANSVRVLITWLDKGECRKKNCSQFYSALQTISSQTRRLQNERTEFEAEIQNAKQLYASRMQSLLTQFYLIEEVFEVVSQQKVWDHFTRAQRKNISVWKKQFKELKNAHIEDVVSERQEDEMDLSDDDSSDSNILKRKFDERDDFVDQATKKMNGDYETALSNDSSQLITRETESDCNLILPNKQKEETENVQILQKTVEELQYELLVLRKEKSIESETQRLKSLLELSNQQKHEIHILSLIAIYLNIHPSGSSVECICDYINSQTHFIPEVDVDRVQTILQSFPDIFKKSQQESKDNYWQYKGFNSN